MSDWGAVSLFFWLAAKVCKKMFDGIGRVGCAYRRKFGMLRSGVFENDNDKE